jgi:HlyD family secretion protein
VGGLVSVRMLQAGQNVGVPEYSLISPRYDSLMATVKAAGQVEPARVVSLRAASAGRVRELLVQIGDVVSENTPLVRFDDRELRLREAQAQALLASAQAHYDKLLAGASPQEIAAAEAQVEQATGQLHQIQGSVSPADLSAAQAQLKQAEIQLATLQAGAKPTDLRAAESQLRQAQVNAETQRNQLSAAKTTAQSKLDQAVGVLTQAQSAYATAKQQWDYVQATGRDPLKPSAPNPTRGNLGGTKPNMVNDAQQQAYYNAYVQAEAAMHGAEQAVYSAQVSYDAARQAEATGVQAAQEGVNASQINLDSVRAGSDKAQIAAAQAQVTTARANLEKLLGEQRSGALQSAQATVEQAQIQLDRLRSAAAPSELAVAQAELANAQATLDMARLAIENATLVAPFGGTVAEVHTNVGVTAAPSDVLMVLADFSQLHVDLPVDEMDVSRLRAGQPVTLTLDALQGTAIQGSIATISPLATNQSTLATYIVSVSMQPGAAAVRAGMSASANIVISQKQHVLVVPRRAVRVHSGRRGVEVLADPALCQLPPDKLPSNPARVQREIQSGASNEQMIEVISGLNEGDCIYIASLSTRSSTPFQTLTGGTNGR